MNAASMGGVVVIDYGLGNVGSIANMIRKAGGRVSVTSSHQEICAADRLVLPGVGAFDEGVRRLKSAQLWDLLNELVIERRKPVLGICLGMQLMTRSSEEGIEAGLGWIEARTVRLKFNCIQDAPRVPHMGWNEVSAVKSTSLFGEVGSLARFYFVHSYHVVCEHEEDKLATTHYGIDFVSAVRNKHICGVQFHPEKSHHYGLSLIRRWCAGAE